VSKEMRKEISWTKLAGAVILVLGLLHPQVALALSFAGHPFVQYGDGQSFALAVDQLLTGCTTPGCPFVIQSSPGQIKDLVVVATGSGGKPVNTNFAGMDNAYSTPNSTGTTFFRTGGVVSPDPGGASQFSGDGANTWDTTLGSLKTFLGGDSLVFFFNNNQINSGASTNQNLAAWAQITIKDASGNVIGTYDFTNDNSTYAGIFDGGGGVLNGNVLNYTSTGAGPTGNPSGSPTDYVFSGGKLCLNGGAPVSCSQPHDQEINNNLGANEAAYAVIFPELNAQLAALFSGLSATDLALFSLNFDLRLGCDPALFTASDPSNPCLSKDLNNGFEQLFIAPLESVIGGKVPEPTSLLLFGSGLLGLLGWQKRRRP
jgi:hypothetical protein